MLIRMYTVRTARERERDATDHSDPRGPCCCGFACGVELLDERTDVEHKVLTWKMQTKSLSRFKTVASILEQGKGVLKLRVRGPFSST